MDKKLKFAFLFLLLFGAAAISLIYAFSSGIAVLSPKGMIGQKQGELLLISTWIMLIVVSPTFLITFFMVWKYRAGKGSKHDPTWNHSHVAEAIWWGVPLLIILVLGVITWKSCHEADRFEDKTPSDSSRCPAVEMALHLPRSTDRNGQLPPIS